MLIRWLYTFILTIVSPFLIYGLYKPKAGKPRIGKRWKEHFGCTPALISTKRPLWIHAVSVGETIAVTPLIKRLKAEHPDLEIVITTTTTTGFEQAEKLGNLATHRYMPLDFPFAVKGFLRKIKPSKLLIMETELWPNTLHYVDKLDIPISIINARLSERSCQRYAKVKPIFNLLASKLTTVLCQYADDAERFVRLGLKAEKVRVTGSIKFDITIDDNVLALGNQLRKALGESRPIWIAASTHDGEDTKVLDAHRALLNSYPDALLILVPRHPERFNAVFQLCQSKGLTISRRTQSTKVNKDTQVYLGDTMGEMLLMMQASDICFMGGSLIGNQVGGHNVLEPAALKKPVITGASYYNFSEVVQRMLDRKAITVIHSSEGLSSQLYELFENQTKRENKGNAAFQCVLDNQGTIQITIDAIINNNIS